MIRTKTLKTLARHAKADGKLAVFVTPAEAEELQKLVLSHVAESNADGVVLALHDPPPPPPPEPEPEPEVPAVDPEAATDPAPVAGVETVLPMLEDEHQDVPDDEPVLPEEE